MESKFESKRNDMSEEREEKPESAILRKPRETSEDDDYNQANGVVNLKILSGNQFSLRLTEEEKKGRESCKSEAKGIRFNGADKIYHLPSAELILFVM